MVYPEAAGSQALAPPDDDRTSITSQNQMSHLVGQMDEQQRARLAAADDDHIATQIASGDLDKMRAMHALQQELGDPGDMDGTVEIQNPMKLWQEAQASLKSKSEETLEEDSSEEMELKTEVADPSKFRMPFGGRSNPGLAEQSDPTFMMAHNPMAESANADAFGDSSPGVDPAGLGSGMHPYAQNTPPSGRAPGPGGFPGANSGAATPPPLRRPQTTSGLNSSQLFEDSEADSEQTRDLGSMGQPALPATPGAAAPDANHSGPWKLRTGFGLTYEFPDTRSLRNWLSSREELDGYVVSADDGVSFYSLDRFPQLDRSSGRQMMPSGNFSMPASHGSGLNQQPPSLRDASASNSGLNQAPAYQPGLNRATDPSGRMQASHTARGPLVNTDYAPPRREMQYRGLLWGLFFLLLLVAIGIALQTFGIFDVAGTFKEVVLGEEAQQQEVAPAESAAPAAAVVVVDPEVLAQKQQAETEKLIKDARREIEANKLQSALDKLETTVAVSPDNAEAYELLADVHARLGQADEAEKAEAKAKKLRGAEAPQASPDAGHPSE